MDGFARRWPWLLVAAGTLIAFYCGGTFLSLDARPAPRYRTEGCVVGPDPFEPPWSPSRLQCAAGVIAGLEILFAGVCVLTHMGGRFPGRVLWRRDGGLTRVLWLTLLLAGAALQAWMIHTFASSRDPEMVLWMSGLAPTFVVPLIALTGCYRAKVTPA
jgi:hypothetical protein